MLPELDEAIVKERIARRIALEFRDGDVVNLGIGIPTLVSEYIPEGIDVIFQAENGALRIGPAPAVPDLKCIGAGGRILSLLPGGSFMASDTSFGLIRGGHVDATVLGALEVDRSGNIANWMVPGKSVPGMGGAMDLVVGAKKVYVAMTHVTKKGESKILDKCTLPLTALGVVTMIFTEFAVFSVDVKNGGLTLLEIAPEVTLQQMREHTGAKFEAVDPLPFIKGMEAA
ncbi:MAG: 3-oxoacid CoA-transferase subunit B [Synergistaceae bacterium]|jgi:3-oxoacid CoA-transferase subunit B/acetate CoA/acetoacetate CoA-transferase beta subunit|nr:3-oxoacid CoA-transferase subunit B [Synergistaceae bacterium]